MVSEFAVSNKRINLTRFARRLSVKRSMDLPEFVNAAMRKRRRSES